MRSFVHRLGNEHAFRRVIGNDGRVRLWRAMGASIEPNVVIGPSVTMRNPAHVSIGSGTYLHAALIESWDHVSIGRNVAINEARLLTASHRIDRPDFGGVTGPITIGDSAWLAMGVIVLNGVTIGGGAVIGAGSVVTKNVPPNEVWAGNPARKIGTRPATALGYIPSAF